MKSNGSHVSLVWLWLAPPCDSLYVAGDEYLISFGSPVSCSSGQILNFELHNFLPKTYSFSVLLLIACLERLGTDLVGLLTGRKPENRTA